MIKVSGKPHKLIKQLKDKGDPFNVTKTTKSTLIRFEGFSYMFADSHFNNRLLNLFQKIKREVHNNITEYELTPPEIVRSKYFQTGQFEPIGIGEVLTHKDCIEFDINKAYYCVLRHFNYISEGFFNECVVLPKQVRLSLVGALATQKTTFYYDKGVLIDYKVKSDEMLRRVFFQLVEYVDRVLDYFSKLASDNFLFYWVDGIYLKQYDRAKIHKKILEKEFKIEFSFEPIKELLVYNQGEYNTKIAVKKLDNKIKNFNINGIFVNN